MVTAKEFAQIDPNISAMCSHETWDGKIKPRGRPGRGPHKIPRASRREVEPLKCNNEARFRVGSEYLCFQHAAREALATCVGASLADISKEKKKRAA